MANITMKLSSWTKMISETRSSLEDEMEIYVYLKFIVATLGYVICFAVYFELDLSKIKCRAQHIWKRTMQSRTICCLEKARATNSGEVIICCGQNTFAILFPMRKWYFSCGEVPENVDIFMSLRYNLYPQCFSLYISQHPHLNHILSYGIYLIKQKHSLPCFVRLWGGI